MSHTLLLITERFPPDLGGVARSAQRLAQSLSQIGVGVEVLTWSRYLQPGETVRQVLSLGAAPIAVHRVGLYRHWDMTMPHTLNVLDWLHERQPLTAVWGHYLFPSGFMGVWFAQLKGIPCVVSARGNDVDRAMFPPGDFARLQWTLAQATQVTAVSRDLAHKVQCLSQRGDVQVMLNAVDTEIFQPPRSVVASQDLRQSLGIADDEVVLGFSGELREKKGQQFLLSALTQVRQARPACLLVIGEGRDSTQALLQRYAAENPEDAQRVMMTGHLPEPQAVAQHLGLCDVYLQPSLWEGLPNALLEAMACGCSCIASDAGGIPEALTHGETGFIVPRSHLHHLGDAVLDYLSLSLPEQRRFGQAACDRIRQHFSLAQERQQLKDLLADLI